MLTLDDTVPVEPAKVRRITHERAYFGAMTPQQRYTAEEIAADPATGRLTRRDAFRRLTLLGLGAPAATALLATGQAQAADHLTPQAADRSPAPASTMPRSHRCHPI